MHKHPARCRIFHFHRFTVQQRLAPICTLAAQSRRMPNEHRPHRVARQSARRAQNCHLQNRSFQSLARPPADSRRFVHFSHAAWIDRRVRQRQQQRHASLADFLNQCERGRQPFGQIAPRHLFRQNHRANPPRRQRAAERLCIRPIADAHQSCADLFQHGREKRAQAVRLSHNQHALAAPSFQHRFQHRTSASRPGHLMADYPQIVRSDRAPRPLFSTAKV